MTWPEDWADRTTAEGCAMCTEAPADHHALGVRVFAGEFLDAYVGTRAAQPGYVVAVWRGRHVNDLTELTPAELGGFWGEVVHVSRGFQRHYRPRKVNYEVLGNQMPHLHAHITARFAEGDVAPGGPLPQTRGLDIPTDVVERDAAALARLLGPASG